MIVDVVIPAFNEQFSVGKVLDAIPSDLVRNRVVVDNNSTDKTVDEARSHGAVVLHEFEQGYGAACLTGIRFVSEEIPSPDVVVFLDGDYSDYPEEMPLLLKPILEQEMDLVIGSRNLGNSAAGSMTPQQVFGNWFATTMLRWIYGYRFTDLGPFRAIRYEALHQLNMRDRNYGWTVEMQIKAAKQGLRCTEVPVSYRKRIGQSKVSGTLKGSILAGYKIILTLIKYA